jgi:hypothetical protein
VDTVETILEKQPTRLGDYYIQMEAKLHNLDLNQLNNVSGQKKDTAEDDDPLHPWEARKHNLENSKNTNMQMPRYTSNILNGHVFFPTSNAFNNDQFG